MPVPSHGHITLVRVELAILKPILVQCRWKGQFPSVQKKNRERSVSDQEQQRSWGEFGGRGSENAYSFGSRAELGIVDILNKLCRAGVEREESMVSI